MLYMDSLSDDELAELAEFGVDVNDPTLDGERWVEPADLTELADELADELELA